jgi:hypothetical protein
VPHPGTLVQAPVEHDVASTQTRRQWLEMQARPA